MPCSTAAEKKIAEPIFLDAWNAALAYEGEGEWHKVLKRFYRHAARRNINGMAAKLRHHGDALPTELCRSFCAVVSSDGDRGFAEVQSTASKLLRNHISDFVRLVLRIKKFTVVPGRFKARIKTSRDSITGAKFVDMRSYLAVRILALCANQPIQDWIATCKSGLFKESISTFEKQLINKLWPKAPRLKKPMRASKLTAVRVS
jgi:hypothetical protein